MLPSPRRRLYLGLLGCALGCALGFAGCSRSPDPWREAKEGQKHILVTFPPLYCLTHAVAGEDAYVLCYLTTDGPHDYSFSPRDAIKARDAHLLIYNGLGLDDAFVQRINARNKVPMLDVGGALPKTMLRTMGEEHQDGPQHAGHKHAHGTYDPHVWLGPPQALVMTDTIAAKLAEVDPPHATDYHQRAGKLKAHLEQLQADGRARFKDRANRKILTMHESIGYFADAFGLKVAGSIQPVPGADADPGRLKGLVDLCKERRVAVITYEPQYLKKQPELLLRELQKDVKVQLAEFDPLETAPAGAGGINPPPSYYFDRMRANIDNLAGALP